MFYLFFRHSGYNLHATWAAHHHKWQLPHVTWHCSDTKVTSDFGSSPSSRKWLGSRHASSTNPSPKCTYAELDSSDSDDEWVDDTGFDRFGVQRCVSTAIPHRPGSQLTSVPFHVPLIGNTKRKKSPRAHLSFLHWRSWFTRTCELSIDMCLLLLKLWQAQMEALEGWERKILSLPVHNCLGYRLHRRRPPIYLSITSLSSHYGYLQSWYPHHCHKLAVESTRYSSFSVWDLSVGDPRASRGNGVLDFAPGTSNLEELTVCCCLNGE